MTVRIHTARVSYGGDDRLDVTRASATGHGLAFAPSWAAVQRVLNVRASARYAAPDDAAAMLLRAWEEYVPVFTEEMRESYRTRRASWEWLLAREAVTLVCFCTEVSQCHRTLLGQVILPRLGAVFCGEREAAEQRRGGVR
jgi:hypothetical protein